MEENLPIENTTDEILENILMDSHMQREESNDIATASLEAQAQTAEAIKDLEPLLEMALIAQQEVKKAIQTQSKEGSVVALDIEDADIVTLQGDKGEKGDKGDTGEKGDKGDKGDTGEQGIQGEKGEKGDTGEKGDKGDAGKDGKDGVDGVNGINGTNGKDGINGKDGKDGKELTIKELKKIEEAIREEMSKDMDRRAQVFSKQASRTYNITELADVVITNPTNGQALTYDSTLGKWKNTTGGGGGGGVWGAITGTLSDQTDLQNALDLKADIASLGATAFSNDYNDLDNLPSIPSQYTDEMAQDAVGNAVGAGLSYNDGTGSISSTITQYTDELAQDAVGNNVGAGLSYNDVTGSISSTITQYTDEQAQDAVGAMVNSTLTYVDATPALGINLNNANTWTADQSVPDEAYGVGWNASVEVPTKNAVYDKIETLPTASSTTTFTNKRITKRVLSTSGPGATPTINTDNYDAVHLTAIAAAITSMTTNLSGTPVEGDMLRIDFTDNGTARAITWGSSFEASTVALPTTTVISTRLDVGFVWNSATSKWRIIASA
jgi:hypothetical protein